MTQLDTLRPHQARMIEAIESMRASASTDTLQKSNRQGWHSDIALQVHPAFGALSAELLKLTKGVFRDYGIDSGDRVFNFEAWANVHDCGGYNVGHVHPGCWLSGTFYLQAPSGSGRIYFTDPRSAARMENVPLRPLSPDEQAGARKTIYIEPKEMMVIMFPSWLEHGVESCRCERRISIAFNITPVQMRQAQADALRVTRSEV